jgi:recombination protein RecA
LTTRPTNEEHRQRVIREKLARMTLAAGDAISTGFRSLDEAAGGLPRGRVVELFGPAGCGKTTIALQIVAAVQKGGGAAAWLDAEHSFDAERAARLGVAVERMPVAQPGSAEQAFEIARRLALSGAVDLLVVDSAAALVPEIELQMGLGEGSRGAHSRALASGLRRVAAALRSSGTAALFLNQTRSSDQGETGAGGPPLKLMAAARIALRGAGKGRIHFRVLKNKASEPFREGELLWREGAGFAESP